jgi:hypothetical protein
MPVMQDEDVIKHGSSDISHSPRFACASLAMASFLVLASPLSSSAHPLLGDCIQHRVSVSVDPTNIDVQVELTFTDMRAMVERRRMDADRDGAVGGDEAGGYAKSITDRQADRFELAIDGQSLPLSPLYDPEVDLGGNPQVMPLAHVVRLAYFARTPEFLKPGSEIVLSDGLWPEAPAVLAMTVAGREGVRVSTVSTDPFAPAGGSDARRLLHARCTAVPEGVVGRRGLPQADTPSSPVVHHARSVGPSSWPHLAAGFLLMLIVVTAVKRFSRRAT